MKFIIILVVVAFATVKGIDIVSDNTSTVIVNHTIAIDNAINEATR
jgi:predicted small integral membrane protein